MSERCDHEWREKVELFLDIPLALSHLLNKQTLRLKSVRIEGANWPKSRVYCAKCGRSGEDKEPA